MNDVGLGIFAFFVELAGINQLAMYFENMSQSVRDIMPIVGIIICVYGILQCFVGYKLFKFWCGVVGLLIGALIGDVIISSGVLTDVPGAYLIGLLIILFLGLICAFVAYRAYMVGLFIYAFVAAFTFVFYLIAIVLSDAAIVALVIGAIAGLAMGVVAVLFRRFWIIVSTSFYGGISICTGLMFIMLSTELGWAFVIPPIFVVAGFLVQNATVKKSSSKQATSTTVQLVYPPVPPEGYPPAPAEGQPAAVPAETPTLEPTVDPDAPTVPFEPVSPDDYTPVSTEDVAAQVAAEVNYQCIDCGNPANDSTAPCSSCGGAVHSRPK